MKRQLRLEQIQADGLPVTIGVLDGDEISVGREAPSEMIVDHSSISRQHGAFASIEHHWVYKDRGSTNGSWVNGVQVKTGQWKFLRPDDVLQLANVVLRAREVNPTGRIEEYYPSLLIFNKGSYQQEVVFSRDGIEFGFGGWDGGLQILGDAEPTASLTVESRGVELFISPGARITTSYLNDKATFETVRVRDGDELSVGQYVVLVSDPLQHRVRLQAQRESGTVAPGVMVPFRETAAQTPSEVALVTPPVLDPINNSLPNRLRQSATRSCR